MHCCSTKSVASGGSRVAVAWLRVLRRQRQQSPTEKHSVWQSLSIFEGKGACFVVGAPRLDARSAANAQKASPVSPTGLVSSRQGRNPNLRGHREAPYPGATCSASRLFASAAAVVPLSVAAATPAAVAAAAKQAGALVASSDPVVEEPMRLAEGLLRPKLQKGVEGEGAAKVLEASTASQKSNSAETEASENSASSKKSSASMGALVVGAICVGWGVWSASYMRQHNLSTSAAGILDVQFLREMWTKMDSQMTRTHEQILNAVEDAISGAFPEDQEPLLPDFKDLNYPEFLPTLVLDFEGVLAKIGHDRTGGYKLRKRPYSDLLVSQLSHFFEVVVWNADQPPVVQTALQQWGLPVTACLNVDHMTRRNGRRIKDFSRLGRRPDRVIYVSCTDEGLDERFRANFIKVPPFGGTAAEMVSDTELLDLVNFLKHCSLSPDDVRSSIARFGGGEDGGVGRRFDAAKKAQESKANQRRSIGKLFGMSAQGGTGLVASQNPTQPGAAFGGRIPECWAVLYCMAAAGMQLGARGRQNSEIFPMACSSRPGPGTWTRTYESSLQRKGKQFPLVIQTTGEGVQRRRPVGRNHDELFPLSKRTGRLYEPYSADNGSRKTSGSQASLSHREGSKRTRKHITAAPREEFEGQTDGVDD
ncbi:hypothetical protein cyc_04241 [Cyclospora cayetanensis]|uniref:FCP1 homology domain-containing protein n=1 Tax=Cyclospora cayetanensis TaxID=88456 RepID=A0A1D3D851_9EIME|nr:hypothetical protein cyc_04241 [Cyclospora cayetanensis]